MSSRLSTVLELFSWVFIRLPVAFSVPFIVLTLSWIMWWYTLIIKLDEILVIRERIIDYVGFQNVASINTVVDALVSVLIFLAGIWIAYNISVFINLLWHKTRKYHLYQLLNLMKSLHRQPWFKIVARNYLLYTEIETLKNAELPSWGHQAIQQEKNGVPSPKIGIILAGGGAKGAYQAGVMRAICEYLEDRELLGHVKMIAGTSIGSWNTLFWLTGLVKPFEGGQKSFQQIWWEHVNIKSTIMPWFYIPLVHNAFLSTMPWKEQFDDIFVHGNKEVVERLKNPGMHYYLTKSNVGSGKLEFVTNNPGSSQGIEDKRLNALTPLEISQSNSVIPTDRYDYLAGTEGETFFETLKNGLFASMNLPPLFAYTKGIRKREMFEDGGVLENLPVYFGTAIETCDLLFVLPLNADFEDPNPNTHSLIARLFRVMTVRQGALEVKALQSIKLYNEMAEARDAAWYWFRQSKLIQQENDDLYEEIEALDTAMDKKQENGNNQGQNGAGEQNDPSTKDKDEDFFKTNYWDSFGAMDEWDVEGAWEIEWQHRNKKTAVFAVCPNKDLAINTAEFWKTKQAAEAFDLMYETVKPKLEKIQPITFEEDPFAAGEREVKLNKDLQNQVMLYKVRTWGSWDAENISETPL